MRIQVPYKVIGDDPVVSTPEYKSFGAAGFDFQANIDRHLELGVGNHHTIPTGIALQIPEGFEIQIRSRSGLATKHGIEVILGTVDQDYRGEIKVVLVNRGKQSFVIAPGMRIAQGILSPVAQASFVLVETLERTQRGKNGLGSTGY